MNSNTFSVRAKDWIRNTLSNLGALCTAPSFQALAGRYAAVEAEKLEHGGVQYVAELFECDAETIRQGHRDVAQLPLDEAGGRVRKKGRPQDR